MKTYQTKTNGMNRTQDVLPRKGFHISYVNTAGTGSFQGDTEDETALCVRGKYFILNGDHRKEYAKCRTLKEARAYFESRPKLKSSWSN